MSQLIVRWNLEDIFEVGYVFIIKVISIYFGIFSMFIGGGSLANIWFNFSSEVEKLGVVVQGRIRLEVLRFLVKCFFGFVIFLLQIARCGLCKFRSLVIFVGFFCIGICVFRKFCCLVEEYSSIFKWIGGWIEVRDKVQKVMQWFIGQYCFF